MSPSDIYFLIDKFTNNDAHTKLEYATSGEKHIPVLFEKICLIEQAENEKNNKALLMQLPIIQRCAYILSISYFNPDFYICPFPKQISLLSTSLNCTVKVIKLLHDIPEASTDRFAAYHPHYKEKPRIILIEFTHNLFLIWLSLKPLSPMSISFDYVGKFAIYH